MNEVRVRFAPSPTGTLHIGGARTALFNWLFARSQGGTFILRLEDTDVFRSSDASAHGILEGLQWLGLDWDEGPDKGGPYGPYRQSERLSLYNDYAAKLLKEGKAYYCFCNPDELQSQREKARQEKKDYKYDGKCLHLSAGEIQSKLEQGLKPVVRIKSPHSGITVVNDLIRGEVEFDNRLLDDFIIVKSDGWPTYNFAVVVDDASMRVSHVIRAEEHLSNTPKQLIIYRALELDCPQFAHVSMILAPDRSKLSKRHGATSVQEFRDQGYLPEALLNYLALLGWSSGDDVDFRSAGEMIDRFRLQDVSKSAAIYDIQKLAWMNGHYLSRAESGRLAALLRNPAEDRGWLSPGNGDYFLHVIDLVKSRARLVYDILDEAEYFFAGVDSYDEKGLTKYFLNGQSKTKLAAVLKIIERCEPFEAMVLEENLRREAENMQLKAADLIHPARLALSGRTKTPGLFEVMELLGREKCRTRIEQAINYVENLTRSSDR